MPDNGISYYLQNHSFHIFLPSFLVFQNSNGSDVTTSLIVALVFDKEHKHVLRDIDELSCSDNFRESNFGLSFIVRDLPDGGHIFTKCSLVKIRQIKDLVSMEI